MDCIGRGEVLKWDVVGRIESSRNARVEALGPSHGEVTFDDVFGSEKSRAQNSCGIR